MPRVVVRVDASYLALFACFEGKHWPVDVILKQRNASRAVHWPKMNKK